jgi:two-component system, chemotaxis family, chemotaxis protein CheY
MTDQCAVLLVEDDFGLRLTLAELLTEAGFEVRSAADGRQALALLHRWRPDLIVLDLDLPNMDGQTFRAIQRGVPSLATIPVIILSGAANLEAQVTELGANDVLRKPCDLELLITAIRQATADRAKAEFH